MIPLLPTLRRLTGLTLGLLLAASPVLAQVKDKPAEPAKDGNTHRLEIYNGDMRSVHYFADGLSASERASLSDVQRLENEVAFTENLARLRAQYVRNERELERRRAGVQNLLYGTSTTYGSGFYPGTFSGGYYGYGYPLLGYGYPGFYNAFYPGYVGSAGTTTQNLAFGVGDEGVIKTEMARVLAAQSSPTYATQARQDYYSALERAASDQRLASVMELKKGDVVPASFEQSTSSDLGLATGDLVTLTPKTGDKIDGTFIRESGDWITVQAGNEQVTLRKSEIIRFSKKPKK
jgi:hypothetical protein